MKLGYIAAVTLVASSIATAHAGMVCIVDPCPMGADDVSQGVRCEVSKVTLMAKDEADCKIAGGKVTHRVITRTEPVKKDESSQEKSKY